jgi:predicted nucleic acid-binding protein
MLLVDTNILVYAADADSPFYPGCRNWLEQQRGRADAWYTSWSILYEFLRVIRE